jgi:NTE family protein
VEQVDKADFEESCGLKIGIALSGGGSRAVAFHLGCLRTLNRLKILDRAAVLSTVSGGSVIGAMYAVHEGSFDEFERLVHQVLRDGFVWPSIRTAVTTPEGLNRVRKND